MVTNDITSYKRPPAAVRRAEKRKRKSKDINWTLLTIKWNKVE